MCTYIIKSGTLFSLGVFINCKIGSLYLIFDSIFLLMCFRLHYLPITYLQSLSVTISFQIIDINPLVLNSQIIHTSEENILNRTLTLLINFQLQSCQRLGCIVKSQPWSLLPETRVCCLLWPWSLLPDTRVCYTS